MEVEGSDRQMRQSIRLRRIAGIPIGMHWTFVVIAALITDLLAASVVSAIIPHQPASDTGRWQLPTGQPARSRGWCLHVISRRRYP